MDLAVDDDADSTATRCRIDGSQGAALFRGVCVSTIGGERKGTIPGRVKPRTVANLNFSGKHTVESVLHTIQTNT
jgi:hypothetical protein